MKATAFDGISRELGQGATRRRCFRLLGEAMAAGAGLTFGAPEAGRAAKRRRKKSKWCNSDLRRCGRACADLRADPRHCGSCGAACLEGERCAGGRCISDAEPAAR